MREVRSRRLRFEQVAFAGQQQAAAVGVVDGLVDEAAIEMAFESVEDCPQGCDDRNPVDVCELVRFEIALVHLIGGRHATAQSGGLGDGHVNAVRVDVAQVPEVER